MLTDGKQHICPYPTVASSSVRINIKGPSAMRIPRDPERAALLDSSFDVLNYQYTNTDTTAAGNQFNKLISKYTGTRYYCLKTNNLYSQFWFMFV